MPHATEPARSPSQQSPGSITRFVRSCFTESLCDVDFTQAMTAVAHLSALEDRRKREFCAALRRLNIDEGALEQQRDGIRHASPQMAAWISSMEDKARKAEALYTQVYIGLRRWALINEMRLLPFDRRNCIAMLDSLYPAEYATLPTPQLTAVILNAQRDAFLKYIEAVAKHGRSVLKNLENQSKRPHDSNGWPVVHDILERYLRQSNRVIDACAPVKGPEVFEKRPTLQTSHAVLNATSSSSSPSSAATRRPSTAQSTPSPSSGPAKLHKAEDPRAANDPVPPRTLRKSRSTLNRLAQEFRRFKSRSADARSDADLRTHSALDSQRAGTAHGRSHSTSPPQTRGQRSASVTRGGCPSAVRDSPCKTHARAASTDRSNSLSTTTTATTTSPSARSNSLSTTVTSPSLTMTSLGSVTIDDAYRERLISEAKARQRSKASESHQKRQHSPTHFKLEEERRYRPRAPVAPFTDRPMRAEPAELPSVSASGSKSLTQQSSAAADPFFFITDAATRRTPVRAGTAPTIQLALPGELKIAELAA